MQHNNSGGFASKATGQSDRSLRHPGVWLAIALGGAAGALLRYSWSLPFKMLSTEFPWAVFSENMVGAFLLGWLLSVFRRRLGKHRLVRAFLGTGLIGSFTTFSAITVDMALFHNEGYQILVWFYPLASVLAGLAAAAAGWQLGRQTHPPDPQNRHA